MVSKKKSCVILDGVYFQLGNTGIARLWSSLMQELSQKALPFRVIVLDRLNTAPKFPNLQYINFPEFSYKHINRDRQLVQAVCDREKADIFISSYYTTPISTPSVFMAYDMIPEVLGQNLHEIGWKHKHFAIHHACSYISISKNTAYDLIKYFPHISHEKVFIAPCGIGTHIYPETQENIYNFKDRYNIQNPYFLLVGERIGWMGYKNTQLFFESFSKWDFRSQYEIVCVGGQPELESVLLSYCQNIPIHVLRLNDEELRAAYSGAYSLVYPSKYEGFGLPVLEAMACRCPVITCSNGSIPEVANNAALYVKDNSIKEMLNAFSLLQSNSIRKTLIQRGINQSKKFSWSIMAESVKFALESTLKLIKYKNNKLDNMASSHSTSITLFTTTKSFQGHPKIIQENAIQSWKKLQSNSEVIIFGDAVGVKEISHRLSFYHIPDVKCNEFGTPLLSDMFEKAQALASNDIIVYINADIILLSDFIPAIQKVADRFPKFLAVGQRWNLDQETLLDLENENWEQELRQRVKAKGKLELGCAIDYFAFTKNLWSDFPDFAVGRPTWDNYTIYRTIADGYPVVDMTEQVTIVHQNHDYSHIPTGEVAHHKGVETDRNRALAIECMGLSRVNTIYAHVGYTNNATWKLTEEGLIRTPHADRIEKLCHDLKSSDPELVRQVYQLVQSVRANPQNPELQKKVQETQSELTRFFLHLPSERAGQYKLGSVGRAYQSLLSCISQSLGSQNLEVSTSDIVEIYLRLSKIYLAEGSLEGASETCCEAIKLQPERAELYQVLSQVLQKQNKLTASTQASQKAKQLS